MSTTPAPIMVIDVNPDGTSTGPRPMTLGEIRDIAGQLREGLLAAGIDPDAEWGESPEPLDRGP